MPPSFGVAQASRPGNKIVQVQAQVDAVKGVMYGATAPASARHLCAGRLPLLLDTAARHIAWHA